MSRGDRTERDLVRLALTGITGLAVLLTLAVNFQRLPLVGGGDTYRAEFADSSGLQAGEEVRVAGVKVGTVTDIELGHARVVVSFRVKGVELGMDTTAGIEIKTLLGQHYLSVTPAGPGRLGPGETIPLERTSTPVDIVPAFQRLTSQAQEIDTEAATEAFDALSETLTQTAPEMKGTLRGLTRLSRAVSTRDEDIRTLFARAKNVSGVVAARDDELGELLVDTGTVLAVLDQRRTTIRQIIRGTAALSRQLTGLVEDNRTELKPALTKLNGVLAVLRANKVEIDQILRTAAVYGREFVNVGGTGRWFDSTLKLPRGAALCDTGSTPGLSELAGTIFGALNDDVNGSRQPCLPLGPATGADR